MTTKPHHITVNGLAVEIDRKAIKNLHLSVYPPAGRVRVAAPLAVSDDAVRLAVISRLGWIRRQRARYAAQPRQSARQMVSGESHYYLGRRYRLRVLETAGAAYIVQRSSRLELHARVGSSPEQRARVLQEWYRERLKKLIPPLLEKWQDMMDVKASAWGVKQMKTRWGSCNAAAGRVWLNLELAKKPLPCLEYVLVHELAHLTERSHNDRFRALLDRFLPTWRLHRDELNAAPLAHEDWDY